jgi:hypothetical protein
VAQHYPQIPKYCGIAIDGEDRGNTNVVLANLRNKN